MQVTFIAAPIALLVVVAVIVGLVMLVRALPAGSGPKVALGVGGLLAFAMLFFGYNRVIEERPVPRNVPTTSTNFGIFPNADAHQPAALSVPGLSWLMLIVVGLAVLVGLVFLIYSLAQSSGGRVALGAGGFVVVLLMFVSFFYLSKGQVVEHQMAVRQHVRPTGGSGWHDDPTDQFQVKPPRVEVRPENLVASVSEPTIPTPSQETASTTSEKPNEKPAWLSQGTQTGNGVSQFPVSSELFSTVSECHKDLDSRMPGLIAEEVRFLRGEPESIALVPGEAQRLVAETYTEEFPITSNGTWYKVHRLIKIDEPTWAVFRMRFQQAQLEGRMLQLGLGLGGLMLILGVVYLFLRRPPRVVDPTLNTFSTT